MQPSINESFEFQNSRLKEFVNNTTSPNSYVCSPFPFTLNQDREILQMDTSFQDNLSQDHAQFVWNASIKYLKNSLKVKFDETKGFNDESIFQPVLQHRPNLQQRKQITELILQISGVKNNEKQMMTSALSFSKNLKKLFERFYQIFGEEITKQLIFVLKHTWQKYTTFKLSKKYSPQLAVLISPAFKSINLQNIQKQTVRNMEYFYQTSQKQIFDNADEAGTQIAAMLFIDNKIRYINLKEAQAQSNDSNRVRKQFQKFMQSITKAIFSCIEGYFCQFPQQQQTLKGSTYLDKQRPSFFDQLEQNLNQGRKRKNL